MVIIKFSYIYQISPFRFPIIFSLFLFQFLIWCFIYSTDLKVFKDQDLHASAMGFSRKENSIGSNSILSYNFQCCNNYEMNYIKSANKIGQKFLDRSVPYKKQRWILIGFLTLYVIYRILMYDFLAIMFFWGLYVLYLLVQFFTPSGLPDPDQDIFEAPSPVYEQSQELHNDLFETYQETQDRPLLRSITEFTLWKNVMLTLIASWFCTLSQIFQIPVYWPFLFIYFVWLIGLAIHKHMRHMKKYGYSPRDFSLNKNRKIWQQATQITL